MATKPTPKPTKKGLDVAVPGGGTFNTATGKTTYKPKDVPVKKISTSDYAKQLKKAVAEHNKMFKGK